MTARPEDPKSSISHEGNGPISLSHLDELKSMIKEKTEDGALKFNGVIYHIGQSQIRRELDLKPIPLFSEVNIDYIYQPAEDESDDSNYYIVIGAKGNIKEGEEDYYRLVLRMIEPAIDSFSDLQDYAFVYGFFPDEKKEERVVIDEDSKARIAIDPHVPKVNYDMLVGGPLLDLLLALELFDPSIHPSIAGLIDRAGLDEIDDDYVLTLIPDTLTERRLSIARESFIGKLSELIK